MPPLVDAALGVPQPGRIRAARFLRELTQPEAVRLMKKPITAAALSQIEAGKVRPSRATLEDLAYALDVPFGFFHTRWPDSSVAQQNEPPTYFRDLASTPVKRRRRAATYAMLFSDLIAAIEERLRLPDVTLPDYSLSPDAPLDEVEEVASAVRQEWDLADEPIPHVIKEIERRGVPVARLLLGLEDVDAFSVGYNRRPVVLLTSDKRSYVRSRFDAAHELAHLLLHRTPSPRDKILETQAHRFAGAFLLPYEVAEAKLPRRADSSLWRNLAAVKSEWGISMGAQLFRAKALRLLPESDYVSAVKYMSVRGWHRSEPGDREMGPPESPLLVERALRTLDVEFSVAPRDLLAEAHLPEEDTLALIQAATDMRPMVEV